MKEKVIKLLMIEDSMVEARAIQQLLARSKHVHFDVEWVQSLTNGLKQLAENDFDLVLTDLQLHDGYGLGTFRLVQEHALDIPIVLMTNIQDETVALKAIASGAQDYLVKTQTDHRRLIMVLQYALERHRIVAELRERYESRIAELM